MVKALKKRGEKYKDFFLYTLVKLQIFSTHSMKYIWYSPQKGKCPLFMSSFLFLINVLFLLFSIIMSFYFFDFSLI